MDAAILLGGWAAALLALVAAASGRRALGRRMELVARACHELRGPLAAARLGLEAAAAHADALRPRLEAVDLELDRAVLALDDLSAARDGRRAPDRRHAVDVRDLLRDLGRAWGPLAGACGSELRVSGPVGAGLVHGDRVRLAQACGNLVANALEHGGGPVEVRGHTRAGTVRIEVRDGGDGLPAPVGELVSRPRGGRGRRGRGLAIAAEIAERHGGRLASAPSSRGARLTLELPAAGAFGAPGRGPDAGAPERGAPGGASRSGLTPSGTGA